MVPLLARMYPNGQEDVNAFHAAGKIPSRDSFAVTGWNTPEEMETVVGLASGYTKMTVLDGKLQW